MPPRAMALPDAEIVRALRRGDEAVFAEVVDAYSPGLMRMARMFVRDRAVAEEVVQETWLGVLRGIDRFEERSSLKTWLFRILVNRARTTGQRERRTVPLGDREAAVDESRFTPDGHWRAPPAPWTDEVEDRLLAAGTMGHVASALEQLPDAQRQ